MHTRFDRSAEDLGNIVGLEHVNVRVPDQRPATLFYISGLGLTRDPYLMTGVDNMWANAGTSQFHLPTGAPQVLRGHTGLVLSDREALLKRLAKVKPDLKDTKFSFAEQADHVDVTCPWGNKIRCHAPEPRFGSITLGIPYVEFDVPVGTAEGIANFYRQIVAAPATVEGGVTRVPVGVKQEMRFRETDATLPEFDGHHIAVYLANFSGPHKRLLELDLISQESNQWQYRFITISDPGTGKKLFDIEHEVRSMTHPLYGRPFVNRNPAQTQAAYAPGWDAWSSRPTAGVAAVGWIGRLLWMPGGRVTPPR